MMRKSRTSEFAQDSKTGRLALLALGSTGWCGPPCDLSDLPVRVDARDYSDILRVNFYGATREIDSGNPHYTELKAALEANQRGAAA